VLDFLVEFFTAYGYVAVFIVLLLCGFGLPIPEDITLVAAGVIAAFSCEEYLIFGNAIRQCHTVHLMFVVAMLGVIIGDGTMFLLGRFYGVHILKKRFFSKIVTPKRYKLAQEKFEQYGSRLIFTARFMPGLRAPIFLIAGITRRISLAKFLLTDGFAALISVPLWVYLGFWGTHQSKDIMAYIKKGQMGVIIALGVLTLVLGGIWIYNKKRNPKKK
jgi:membrane protein DedA with SNARE-associated domain